MKKNKPEQIKVNMIRSPIKRTLITGAVLAALVIQTSVSAACWVATSTLCGFSPTPSTYTVFCGGWPINASFCDGTSPGLARPDVMSSASGAFGTSSAWTRCMAPVTLVGTCCGGARTTTSDWSWVQEKWPANPGCPGTSG
jgi:hypothetical protein